MDRAAPLSGPPRQASARSPSPPRLPGRPRHPVSDIAPGFAVADVDAIRSQGLPGEPKLAALSRLARALVETRGKPDPSDRAAFLDAGFTPEHLLEVIAVNAASTITNCAANVTEPPLEAEFGAHRWHAV